MSDQKEIVTFITNPPPFNFWAINAISVDGKKILRKGDFTDYNTFSLLVEEAGKMIETSPDAYDIDHHIEFILFNGEEYISPLNFEALNKKTMPKKIKNAYMCLHEQYRQKYMSIFGLMALMPQHSKR